MRKIQTNTGQASGAPPVLRLLRVASRCPPWPASRPSATRISTAAWKRPGTPEVRLRAPPATAASSPAARPERWRKSESRLKTEKSATPLASCSAGAGGDGRCTACGRSGSSHLITVCFATFFRSLGRESHRHPIHLHRGEQPTSKAGQLSAPTASAPRSASPATGPYLTISPLREELRTTAVPGFSAPSSSPAAQTSAAGRATARDAP